MTKQEAKILARNAGLRFREMINEFCDGNQKEFSKKTGIGESSITGYLSYANVPSSQTGFKVYDAFGINPMWTIGYPDAEKYGFGRDGELKNASISERLTNYEEQLLQKFRSLPAEKQHSVELLINALYAEVSP